jgi:hypothetical protein
MVIQRFARDVPHMSWRDDLSDIASEHISLMPNPPWGRNLENVSISAASEGSGMTICQMIIEEA